MNDRIIISINRRIYSLGTRSSFHLTAARHACKIHSDDEKTIQIGGTFRALFNHVISCCTTRVVSWFRGVSRQVSCIFRRLFSSGVYLAFDRTSINHRVSWSIPIKCHSTRLTAIRGVSFVKTLSSDRPRIARCIEWIRGSRYASAINIYPRLSAINIYSRRFYGHAREIGGNFSLEFNHRMHSRVFVKNHRHDLYPSEANKRRAK